MSRNEPAPLPAKLYNIRFNDCCNFVAGTSAKGEQVLIGVIPGHVVAVFFDPSGRLVRDEVREASIGGTARLSQAKRDQPSIDAEWRLLNAWKAEIGLVASDIRVAKFSLPAWDGRGAGIGVFDLPQFMQDCADDPLSEPDDQFRHELLDGIEEFRSQEKYVLRWGTEYWMSKDGEITDT
jgi:hypothetical protein